MSIKVSNVFKHYGKQAAVSNVSFEVKPGNILGFLGPNGAGKSTLMKIICAYLEADQGEVEVCGMRVEKGDVEVKKRIGYLPEHNPLYLDMYVKEFLDYVCGLHGIKNKTEAIEKAIKLTGLTPERSKKIRALSKGYRQRVGIAQAIIHDPEVLILDEPTTGLDPNQIVEIRELIKSIGKNKTVMLSTHIMQEVEAVCDRVIIINKGEVIANEDIDSITQLNKEEIYTVQFDEELDISLLSQLPETTVLSQSNKKTVEIQSKHKDIKKLVSQLALDNKNSVVSIESRKAKLEDIFHELTK